MAADSCSFCLAGMMEEGMGTRCPHCNARSHFACVGLAVLPGSDDAPTPDTLRILNNAVGILIPCNQCRQAPGRFNLRRDGSWLSAGAMNSPHLSPAPIKPREDERPVIFTPPVSSRVDARPVLLTPTGTGGGLSRLHRTSPSRPTSTRSAKTPTAPATRPPKLLAASARPATRCTSSRPATRSTSSRPATRSTPHVVQRLKPEPLGPKRPGDLFDPSMSMDGFSDVTLLDGLHVIATVYTGVFRGGSFAGRKSAIKMFPKKLIQMEQLVGEVGTGAECWSSRIVKVFGVFQDESTVYLALEYCPGGDLYDLVMARGRLSESASVRIMAQIAQALCYLQSLTREGLAHGAVKPEHILLTATLSAKLSDGGSHISRIARKDAFKSSTPLSAFCGSTAFDAPEVNAGSKPDCKSDIFSLGIVLWAMLVGDVPFGKEVAGKRVATTVASRGLPTFPAGVALAPSLTSFLKRMLKGERSQRLGSLDDLLASPHVQRAMKHVRVKLMMLGGEETGKEESTLGHIRASLMKCSRPTQLPRLFDVKAEECLGCSYNRGPDQGHKLFRGRFQPALDDAVFSLGVGQVSVPVRSHRDVECGCVGGTGPCAFAWFLFLRLE